MDFKHATAPQPLPKMSNFSLFVAGASLNAKDDGATNGSAAGTPIAQTATQNARRECGDEKNAWRKDAMPPGRGGACRRVLNSAILAIRTK
jgi:hypothetical protein